MDDDGDAAPDHDPDSDADVDADASDATSDETDSNPSLSVDELVDYCHTQAGLLSGRVDTMATEADALLDEIDERTAEIRSRLEDLPDDVEATERPPSTTAPASGESDVDLEAIEALQDELEEKQLLAEAKHTRMQAFQELAADYTELAADLATDVESGRDAIRRVVEFEADNDAPAYFEEQDRTTLLEMAAEADDTDGDASTDDGTE
ncbi:hypothetical protein CHINAEXTREME_07845 [Halobiforma lacisalsi AJ5]|uniref:Uncharacterized protein n=1 Tax=Natronobacterium lacisalsi AJ5 TaxID=358396 RepID=M0LXU7_NATLA|nr:hypothetical protein [Halobiforma lacisalsi]APW97690.1 hypothetical protein CHINAEXTREME_07845 [Halobiforma lacisalsi AJ5]EMA36920.1 hypothetical protein C445_01721 [Halobiforma lacisalsi AJ5]